MQVGLPGYGKSEALRDFPALVKLRQGVGGFDYRQFASGRGGDLRFADATGTNALAFEIEKWDTNGTSWVWVRVPELAGTNLAMWAYWGNAAGTNLPASSTNGTVWSANHEVVFHLAESSGTTARDSSGKGRNATWAGSGTAVAWTSGVADGAAQNVSRKRYLLLSSPGVTLSTEWSLSVWYRDLWGTTAARNLAANTSASTDRLLYVPTDATNACVRAGEADWNTGCAPAGPTGVWQQVAVVARGGRTLVYLNGREAGQCVTNVHGAVMRFLGASSGSQSWSQYTDEMRLDSVARSSNWVWACWQTVADHEAFTRYGSVENHHPTALEPDVDGDGMPDAWEIAHFPQGMAALPEEDDDGDTMVNRAEYVAGTDPTNVASCFEVWVAPWNGGRLVSFFGVAGTTRLRLYSLENATNLLAPGWYGVSHYTNLPGADRLILYTNPPSDPGPRLFRGKVWLQE